MLVFYYVRLPSLQRRRFGTSCFGDISGIIPYDDAPVGSGSLVTILNLPCAIQRPRASPRLHPQFSYFVCAGGIRSIGDNPAEAAEPPFFMCCMYGTQAKWIGQRAATIRGNAPRSFARASRFDSGWPAASPSPVGYNLALGLPGLDDGHDGHSMEAGLIV